MKLTLRQIKLVKDSLEYISRRSKSTHLNDERSDIWERLDKEQYIMELDFSINVADLISNRLMG